MPFLPRPRLLGLVLAACVLLALGQASAAFLPLALAVLSGALVLAVADARATPALGPRELSRLAEGRLSIGAPHVVRLAVRNPTPRPLEVVLRDEVPPSFATDRTRVPLRLGPYEQGEATYVARPRHRGSYRFGRIHSRQAGPFGLVERQGSVDATAPANVYPDLREVRRYDVTVRRGLAYAAGERRARVPGAGSLFERLREHQPDDDPRSISWKATARRGRLVSVEYEAERQQRVIVVLDAGRMMASTLGELTKLDHAVNTALMLAHVATAKGDEVGLLGFADAVRAYAPPRRGRRQFLVLAEELRRVEPALTESDHSAAFEFLRARSGRRALVVLFTDLVDEDASRSLVAAVTRLAGQHLVLVCLLEDPRLAEVASARPATTQDLYERVVAREVRDARDRAVAVLRRRGAHVIDVPAERLTVATVSRYLELKRRLS